MPWFAFRPRSRRRMIPRGEFASSRNQQADDAYDALIRVIELAARLEEEIRSRQATLDAIEADITTNRTLSSIDQGQAASIVTLVDAATRAAHQRLLRTSRVDQVVFFLAGVVVSTTVELVLSWLAR